MERAKLSIAAIAGPVREASLGSFTGIGRGRGNDLQLDDPRVSRQHAVIRRFDDGYVLSDLGSANGTYLNNRRVLVPERLYHGDNVQIGATRLNFVHPPSRRADEKKDRDDATAIIDAPTDEVVVFGVSQTMTDVFALMRRAAVSTIPILLLGETGTGKELVARAIHSVSARSKRPFVAINCAALPETLLESQLFGHRRGAFTGANHDQAGLFDAADGGTILLDEIGEMPLAMQAKLLRVLQEGEITPLGETRPRRVDVRVLSATNRNLESDVQVRTFRQDLYYRLAAFPITLPPLRERREDIPLLSIRFMERAARRQRKDLAGFDDEAHACLMRYGWPGNVRELQNEIERAVVLADEGDAIRCEHLSGRVVSDSGGSDATDDSDGIVPPRSGEQRSSVLLADARAEFEAKHIARVLEQQGGNVSRAAEALGMSRVGLHRKLKDFGLR